MAFLRAELQATWTGPLPPPAALQAFDEAAPGSAALIIQEFQAEAAHRRALELGQAKLIARETHVGQALAIAYALAALGVAAYAASVGAEWIGSIVGGGVILSGIVAFLRGRATPPREPPQEP